MALLPFGSAPGITTATGDGRYVLKAGDTMTGNLTISKSVPEARLISNDTNYSRINRADTGNVLTFYNQVLQPAATDYSLTFNGTTDNVTIPDSTSLRISTVFTISAWIKLTNTTGVKRVYQKDGNFSVNGTKLRFTIPSVVDIDDTGSGVLSATTWTHVAIVHTGTGYQFYVAGAASANITNSNNVTPSVASTTIGWTASGSEYFAGNIDDVRVYSRALSSAEITTLSTGGDPSSTNLGAQWKFDEGTGTTASDSSGNSNTGTVASSSTWSTDVPTSHPGNTGTLMEVPVATSINGSATNEQGIHTFGAPQGGAVIQGQTLKLKTNATVRAVMDNNGHLYPNVNNAYNLGSTAYYYQYIYGTRHYFNSTAYLDGGTAGLLAISGSIAPVTDSTSALKLTNAAGTSNIFQLDTTNKRIGVNSAGAPQRGFTLGGGNDIVVETMTPVLNAPSVSGTGGTLAAGTYYYVVVAFDTGSNSTRYSNEVSATVSGTTSSVTLTWGAVPGASYYWVYRGTSAGGESVYYTASTALTYTDTNATITGSASPPANTTSYYTKLSAAGNSWVQGGSFGIGTVTPSQKLEVNGMMLVDGTVYANSGDRATVYLGDTNTSFTAVRGTGATMSAYQVTDGLVLQQTTGYIGIGNSSPTAWLHTKASIAAAASLRIPAGTAPTTPNDGDIWYDGTNLKMRVGATTKTFTLT